MPITNLVYNFSSFWPIFSRYFDREMTKLSYSRNSIHFEINLLLHGTEQQIFYVMILILKSKMSSKKAATYFQHLQHKRDWFRRVIRYSCFRFYGSTSIMLLEFEYDIVSSSSSHISESTGSKVPSSPNFLFGRPPLFVFPFTLPCRTGWPGRPFVVAVILPDVLELFLSLRVGWGAIDKIGKAGNEKKWEEVTVSLEQKNVIIKPRINFKKKIKIKKFKTTCAIPRNGIFVLEINRDPRHGFGYFSHEEISYFAHFIRV